jgi:hypothetical protein
MCAPHGGARHLFGGPRVRRSFSDFFFYFARFSRRSPFVSRAPTARQACCRFARGALRGVRLRARFRLAQPEAQRSRRLSSRDFLLIARSIDPQHLVFFKFTS